jgi:hypothetical protein
VDFWHETGQNTQYFTVRKNMLDCFNLDPEISIFILLNNTFSFIDEMPRPCKKTRIAREQRAANHSTFRRISATAACDDDGSEWENTHESDSDLDDSDDSDSGPEEALTALRAFRKAKESQERKCTVEKKDIKFLKQHTGLNDGSQLRGTYTGKSRTTQWRSNIRAQELANHAKKYGKVTDFFSKKRPRSSSASPPPSTQDTDIEILIDDIVKTIVTLRLDSASPDNNWQSIAEEVEETEEGEEGDAVVDVTMVSADVEEAREWVMDEEDEEETWDILDFIVRLLKEVQKLHTPRALKLIMHLTATADYIRTREILRRHPKCKTPAKIASLRAAAKMGKGPAFARQVRSNEHHLMHFRELPINLTKTGRKRGPPALIDDERVQHGARRYLAAQSLGAISSHEFALHVSDVLLPSLGFTGDDASICERTAIEWLHKLGYECVDAKKGMYHDGHERPDVGEARTIFLDRMSLIERLMITYQGDDMTLVYPQLGPGEKIHIVLNQDESIVHTNEYRHRVWVPNGEQPLRRKGNGRAIHISDFICEPIGRLRLTGGALSSHTQLPMNSPSRLPTTEARKVIYPGKNHDKWWDIHQLMDQVVIAVKIFERQFPNCVGVWIFDCSSAHEALAPDALNINNMNVKPGGKQPAMRDTIIPMNNPPPFEPGKPDPRGQVQSLVYPDPYPADPDLAGKPKGLKATLKERGAIWEILCQKRGGENKVTGKCAMCKLSEKKKDALRRIAEAEATGQVDDIHDRDLDDALTAITQDDWCCIFCVLSLQEDFRCEKSMLQTFIEEKGHICLFLPKFHCELAPIELLWGYGKYREFSMLHSCIGFLILYFDFSGFRQVADGKFTTAKELVPQCLDMADEITIRRFFRKTWRYMDAYRKGLNAREAAFAVKKYKSHRRVGTVAEVRQYMQLQELRKPAQK